MDTVLTRTRHHPSARAAELPPAHKPALPRRAKLRRPTTATPTPGHHAFTVPLSVEIRRCERQDLRPLEWFGEFTPHREIFEATFAAQERGEGAMLVAMVGAAPIGQVWVDFERVRATDAGLIWALRVFPWFQGHGLGTRLLHAAEKAIADAGLAFAEIGVERGNAGALRLYLRQGFTVSGEVREPSRYRTPDGVEHEVWSDEIRLRKGVGAEPAS